MKKHFLNIVLLAITAIIFTSCFSGGYKLHLVETKSKQDIEGKPNNFFVYLENFENNLECKVKVKRQDSLYVKDMSVSFDTNNTKLTFDSIVYQLFTIKKELNWQKKETKKQVYFTSYKFDTLAVENRYTNYESFLNHYTFYCYKEKLTIASNIKIKVKAVLLDKNQNEIVLNEEYEFELPKFVTGN